MLQHFDKLPPATYLGQQNEEGLLLSFVEATNLPGDNTLCQQVDHGSNGFWRQHAQRYILLSNPDDSIFLMND